MKRSRPDSPDADSDTKAPEKRARESVLTPAALTSAKTTNGFFKDSGLKPSEDYGKKLLELAEKQEKEKKPIELQDPAKAHAPSSFAEKENEKRPEQSDDAQTKPIFGTFGKNLTEKVTTENGAGDKTEVEEKKEDKPSNPWSSALKKNGGFGSSSGGFGFKKSGDSENNPFKKLGEKTNGSGFSNSGKSVFASTKTESEKVTEDVKTGEEEETNCLNITTARLFKFDKESQQYKERGRGVLRMNDKGSGSDFSSRLVFRTAGTQRVALNTQIWAGMSVEKCTQKSIRISAQDSSDGDENTVGVFLIQCGVDQANELFKALDGRIAQIKQKNET